jgi:hypothetical protein
MSSRLRRAFACVLFAASLSAAVPAVAAADSPGAVRFLKRTDSSFDRFTTAPTPGFKSWMNEKFWRAEVFTPYFDSRTSWYPNGLVYLDSYALYRDSPRAKQHPDWILRDGAGNRLFIPWGCGGGTCPQYAGDITNPAFRQAFIAMAKAAMTRGYKGIWVDDVNLELQVGDGSGRHVDPIDPRTGRPMTAAAWRGAMATFMEELRAAVPQAELLHNSIWYAGEAARDRDPSVRRQIAASDYVNLERGVNDDGLTGGSGEWSLHALFGFVDRVHAAGKGVILDGGDGTPVGREYNLAAYYLLSTGRDAIGLGSMTPESWWTQYDRDLGRPTGPRTQTGGLWRRDFTNGTVLLNEPGAPTRTVSVGGRTITLHARSGAVVNGPAAATTARVRRLSVTVAGVRRTRAAVRIHGRVKAARTGRVEVVVARRHGSRWRAVRRVRPRVDRSGRYSATVARLPHGRYRARAAYGAGDRATVSRPRAFAITR